MTEANCAETEEAPKVLLEVDKEYILNYMRP
jgi:hypothetical protein